MNEILVAIYQYVRWICNYRTQYVDISHCLNRLRVSYVARGVAKILILKEIQSNDPPPPPHTPKYNPQPYNLFRGLPTE